MFNAAIVMNQYFPLEAPDVNKNNLPKKTCSWRYAGKGK